MQELEKIFEEIEAEHPYKVPGNYDSYSQYNEAWSDAIYRVRARLEEFFQEKDNDGWISVEERLPEPGRIVLITQTYSWENFEEGASVTIGRLSPEKNNKMWEFQYYRPDFRSGTIMDNDIICPGSKYVIAWRPLPEPYRPERSG